MLARMVHIGVGRSVFHGLRHLMVRLWLAQCVSVCRRNCNPAQYHAAMDESPWLLGGQEAHSKHVV